MSGPVTNSTDSLEDKEHMPVPSEAETDYMVAVCGVARGQGDPDAYGYPGESGNYDIIVLPEFEWDEVQ